TAQASRCSPAATLPLGSDQSSYFGRWTRHTSMPRSAVSRHTSAPAAKTMPPVVVPAGIAARRPSAPLLPRCGSRRAPAAPLAFDEHLLQVDQRFVVGTEVLAYPRPVRFQVPRRGARVEGEIEQPGQFA